MRLYFTEAEPSESAYYKDVLDEHELIFLTSLEEVPSDAEAISTFIYSDINARFLDTHPALRLVVTRSSTYDHIDLAECERRNITVSYVESYGDHTVAEHTMALLLALTRRLREILLFQRKSKMVLENLRLMELHGKTFGIIGTGRIGQRTIPMAKAFGMNVVAYDIHRDRDAEHLLGFHYADFDDLLHQSDVISLHASLNAGSFHMMNREAFRKCRRGVILLNTARGALVDTKALVEALDDGIVRAAGVDVLEDERVLRQEVFDVIGAQILKRLSLGECAEGHRETNGKTRLEELHELVRNEALIARPNVLFTPHLAFNSEEATERMKQTTVENIRAFFDSSPINVVSKQWLTEPQR
jgi:D-lactate dehydrogenase